MAARRQKRGASGGRKRAGSTGGRLVGRAGTPVPKRGESSTRRQTPPARDAVVEEALAYINSRVARFHDLILEIGAYVLKTFFGNDPDRALDPRRVPDPGFQRMRELAGGRLRLSDSNMSRALALAAWDRKVQGGAWRELEAGRKIILLRLHDADLMREGAQHAIDWDPTDDNLRVWVRERLSAEGEQPTIRVSLQGFSSFLGGAADRLNDPARTDRVVALADDDPEMKQQLVKQLEAVQKNAAALLKRLRKKR